MAQEDTVVSQQALVGRLRLVAKVFAWMATAMGITVLIGWVFDIAALTHVLPQWPTMKPNSAVSFIAIGLSLQILLRKSRRFESLKILQIFLALLAGTVGFISLLEYYGHWSPNIDQLLIPETHTQFPSPLGRMAPITALNFCLTSVALVLIKSPYYRIAQGLALVCAVTSFLAIQGFFYGVEFLFQVPWYASIAFHSAVCFLLCSLAIVFMRVDEGMFETLLIEPGGVIIRRIVPLFVVTSLVMGWLRIEGEQRGLYPSDFGVALHGLFNIVFISMVVWFTARSLNRTQQALRRAQRELKNYAEQLESRVAQRTAQLENSVNSMQNLVYTIAHDLRAPLRAMRGFSQALIDDAGGKLDQMNKEHCRRIDDAAKRMDDLITDLLAYGHLANTPVVTEMVNLNEEIDAVCDDLKSEVASSHLHLEVEEHLPRVCGEKKILHQVLMNLISNAIKFARPGTTPEVHVYAEPKKTSVRLWFEDNGIGIAPEYCDKIFEIFQRLHSNEIPGTGMGLAIVKKGVEQLRGKVGVESQPGKGSRFWIELPTICLPSSLQHMGGSP